MFKLLALTNSTALYTTDLFSSYMAYKHLWKQLSDMLKTPRAYKAQEKCKEVPDPIQTDPVALDQARLEARKALVEITNEVRFNNPSYSTHEANCLQDWPEQTISHKSRYREHHIH